ncbi:hypothetical protein AB0N17_24175 [Streptomyces sp. NPDC051133]|uniref:hypothetical protein n=1 Tax=Streptomyces sp. NPDC051133 TaxID=3155521 RepID=UPI00343B2180
MPGEGPDGEPQVPPNVYLPQSPPAPSYEEYNDPAAAHGWQNAYDETRELPPLRELTDETPPGAGRAARRRAERRTGGPRRVAVVAGVLGAAGAAALLAVLAGGSDSPAPDGSGPAGGKRVTVGDSASASDRAGAGSPSVSAPPATAGSSSAVSGGSASSAVRASRTGSAGTPVASATPSAPVTSGPPTPTHSGIAPGPTASASAVTRARAARATADRHARWSRQLWVNTAQLAGRCAMSPRTGKPLRPDPASCSGPSVALTMRMTNERAAGTLRSPKSSEGTPT